MSVGDCLIIDPCRQVQPTVGSTIPSASGPELCKKLAERKPRKQHSSAASASSSCLTSLNDGLSDLKVQAEINPLLSYAASEQSVLS